MPGLNCYSCPGALGACPMGALQAVLGNASYRVSLYVFGCIAAMGVIFGRLIWGWMCPFGAIYGLFNPISSYRLVIDKDKCVSCGTCQRACGMDIKTFETPNSPDCIRCGSCMAACPAGAIESTWHKTGQKIKRRCFIDDGDILPARITTSETTTETAEALSASSDTALLISSRKPLFLGILMIIAGAGNLYSALGSVVDTLETHYLVDAYADMNVGTAITDVLWCVSSLIVIMTGVYTLRFSKQAERLLSVNEKLKVSWIIAIIGFAIGIAGIIKDVGTAMSLLMPLLFNTFVYAGVLVLMLQVKLMYREIKWQKSSNFLWLILSIINIVLVAASPWLVMYAFSTLE